MKIANIVGARPNLVKIAPLMAAMKRPEIQPLLIHTGQHYDEQMSDVFFRQMRIPEPDVNLEVGSGTHGWQTAEILKRVETVFIEHKPDLVLVVGDVNSTIAASIAAAKLGIPIAHVEAGLRSFDRTMPEEINRVLTDSIADYLFVTEEDAIENLLREGRSKDCIYMVGNVMIDALQQFLPIARQSKIGQELGLIDASNSFRSFGVLTLHRPANVDSPDQLRQLMGAVENVASQIPVIFPAHPRTQQKMQQAGLQNHGGIRIVPPLGYLDFVCLLSHATIVLTDSGGIQEETTSLGVPCLTLRENTERPVTAREGTNQIVGQNPEKITRAAQEILSGTVKKGRSPRFWDGKAAQRIVDTLVEILH